MWIWIYLAEHSIQTERIIREVKKMSFIFKGVSSDHYGVAREVTIPIAPPTKTQIVSIPCGDGDVDFTGSTGHTYYEDTVFTIELQVRAESPSALKTKMINVGQWLRGSGILIDNDGYAYEAKCYEGLNYQPEMNGKFCKLTINFRISSSLGEKYYGAGWTLREDVNGGYPYLGGLSTRG